MRCSCCFGLLFMLKLAQEIGLSQAATREFTFTQASATILDDHEFRLTATSWSDVSSIVSCAQMTISECPSSRGFMYASGTGHCSPLLWLHEGSGVASQSVPDGELYLTTGGVTCPQGFQVVEFGDASQVTCLRKITPATSYNDATSQCSMLGGHLASVKTSDKLAMVVAQAQGLNIWIGLDDQVEEGRFIWQADSEELTTDQLNAVFASGNPNNDNGREHCVQLQASVGRLNDNRCWVKSEALCETSLVPPDC